MPKPHRTNGRANIEPSLRVEVLVQAERVLVSCGNGQETVDWLIDQVTERCLRHPASDLNGQVVDKALLIKDLRTQSGALLPRSYRLSEILKNGDVIHAQLSSSARHNDANGAAEPVMERHNQAGVTSNGSSKAGQEVVSYFAAYGHPARVFALAFSPTDSNQLASASDDSTVKVWRHNNGSCTQEAAFLGHSDSVMCVSWNSDGTVLATGSADTHVKLWRPSSDSQAESLSRDTASYGVELLQTIEGHPEEVYAAHFVESGTSQQILSASKWTPYLWDVATCQSLGEGSFIPKDPSAGSMPKRWEDAHIFSMEVMPGNGQLAAATCSDGAVRFWRMGQGSSALQPHAICEAHSSGMGSCCAWSPDGQKLASTATDGSIVILDIRMTGRVCWERKLAKPIFNCQFLPSAPESLAVCGGGPNIYLLDTSSSTTPDEGCSLLEHPFLPYRIPTRTGNGETIIRSMGDLRVSQEEPANHSIAMPDGVIHSQSALAARNLLCLAASLDGAYIAASGEPAKVQTTSKKGIGRARDGHTHQTNESIRSPVEVWELGEQH